MGDKITYTTKTDKMEDSRGNVIGEGGVYCATTKDFVPIKDIPLDLLHHAKIIAEASTDKLIDLGNLRSPLESICEAHAPKPTSR